MEADRLLTTAEAAQVLNTPVATLRWWRHKRIGPKAFRLGPRKIMYKQSDLTAWMDKQYNATQASA